MTFFNKKEDVIKIELTPYGRHLLSQGKLKPSYYAFFDDDILYDIEAAGGTEEQNEIVPRILEETPRIRPQVCLESPNTSIFESDMTTGQLNSRPKTREKVNFLTEPLGSSDNVKETAPGFRSVFIQGEIDSVEATLVGSYYEKQIPQINTTIEYKMQIRNEKNDPLVRGRRISPRFPASATYSDGTYVDIEEEQIITFLKEVDGFEAKEGFEVEVYLFDDTDEENLIPLKFTPAFKSIIDGILVEPEESDVEITPEYVEYYVNFTTDSNIPDREICEGISKLKAEDIHIDIQVECEDVETTEFDIYGTRVTDVEVCE